MDEPGRVSRLLFIIFVLLVVFSISSSSSSSTDSDNATKESVVLTSAAEKVELVLYYETLCPYCSNFIVNYLDKILFDPHNDLISIVDLHLIPYGNAKISPVNNSISCQHGPSECLLNTIEACAIDAWPNLNEHFPFIYCVESLVYDHKYPQWEECFNKLGLDPKPISDCYNSGYGKELELRYAAETNNLQPPHKYVPWVVVDGEPLYEDYENFVDYVCKAYKGTSLPSACSKASSESNTKYIRNPIGEGCYTEETTRSSLLSRIGSVVKTWMEKMDLASDI